MGFIKETEWVRNFISNSGGRRFVITIGNAVVSTYLLMGGYLSGEIYRDLIIVTTAVYIGANTTQKFKKGADGGEGL